MRGRLEGLKYLSIATMMAKLLDIQASTNQFFVIMLRDDGTNRLSLFFNLQPTGDVLISLPVEDKKMLSSFEGTVLRNRYISGAYYGSSSFILLEDGELDLIQELCGLMREKFPNYHSLDFEVPGSKDLDIAKNFS